MHLIRNIFNFKVLLYIILAISLIAALFSQGSTLERERKESSELAAKVAQAEAELKELTEEAESVGTDEYIEGRARRELGYVKSYEIVYVKN